MASMSELYNIASAMGATQNQPGAGMASAVSSFLTGLQSGQKQKDQDAKDAIENTLKAAQARRAELENNNMQFAQAQIARQVLLQRQQQTLAARANANNMLRINNTPDFDNSSAGKLLGALQQPGEAKSYLQTLMENSDVTPAGGLPVDDPNVSTSFEYGPSGATMKQTPVDTNKLRKEQSDINETNSLTNYHNALTASLPGREKIAQQRADQAGAKKLTSDPKYKQALDQLKYYQGIGKNQNNPQDIIDQANTTAQQISAQMAEFTNGSRDTFDIPDLELKQVEEPGKVWGHNTVTKLVPRGAAAGGSAAAGSADPAQGASGKVLVINPSGDKGYISESNLDKALKAGYKRAN